MQYKKYKVKFFLLPNAPHVLHFDLLFETYVSSINVFKFRIVISFLMLSSMSNSVNPLMVSLSSVDSLLQSLEFDFSKVIW